MWLPSKNAKRVTDGTQRVTLLIQLITYILIGNQINIQINV